MNRDEILKAALECKQQDGSIDIIQLALKAGIDVYGTDDSNSSAEIVHIPAQDKFEILVNTNLSLHQQRFSIAHEIAHFVLHPQKIREYGSLKRSSDQSDPKHFSELEKEADEFGGELLMPEKLLCEFFPEIFENKHKLSFHKVHAIAETFKVSALVAAVRLRKLDLDTPYISYAFSA
jgi:Zn-dependent peptidase ImmA (M78 family)